MRQRRRHHTEERLVECAHYLLPNDNCPLNALEAVEKKAYFDWENFFPSQQPLYVEIGCGKGSFASEYCTRHPDINFVAVERNANIILATLETAEKSKQTNLRVLHSPCEVLTRYFRPHTVEGIFLNFSTPLPRKPFVRQRLTHPRFLALYKEMLVEGGKIYFKTDSKDFYEFSKEQFLENGFELLCDETDLYKSDKLKDNIATEYETRFVNLGKPIFMMIAKKKEN